LLLKPLKGKAFLAGLIIAVVLLSQHFTLFQPMIRNNCDLVISFPMNGESMEAFVTNYFTGGTKKDKMKRLTDIISGDFRCVVVNLVSKSLRFEDNTFSYKANKTPDFFIGPKKKKKEKEIEENIIKSNFFNKRPF